MAQIVLPNAYVDGVFFDADAHAQNLHDAAGSGLFSESNGRLSAGGGGNLAANWKIRAEHVQPGCLIKFFQHANRRPVSLYNDAAPDVDDTTYVQLGDASAAFDLDYAPGLVFWQWQFYVHVFRPERITPNLNPVQPVFRPKILLKTYINGAAIQATIRGLPTTALFDSGDGAAVASASYLWEDLAAQWWSMQWLSTGVLAGPQSVSIRVSMEEPTNRDLWIDRNVGSLSVPAAMGYNHRMFSRITFGIRGAVGIPMWQP